MLDSNPLPDVSTSLYGLIGSHIRHSLSPRIHNAAFKHFHINAIYIPIQLKVEGTGNEQIRAALQSCVNLNFSGLNITMPFKGAVLDLMDYLHDDVRATRAANTILNCSGVLKAYNTDIFGFIEGLNKARVEIMGSRCLVIGAGGAAKAACHALSIEGADHITLANRNPYKAIDAIKCIEEAALSRVKFNHLEFKQLDARIIREFDLIVNATPVGMADSDQIHAGTHWEFSRDQVFYDLVYFPLETKMMEMARRNGALAIGGLDMLIFQAMKSFEIWTGYSPSYSLLFEEVAKYLQTGEQ